MIMMLPGNIGNAATMDYNLIVTTHQFEIVKSSDSQYSCQTEKGKATML